MAKQKDGPRVLVREMPTLLTEAGVPTTDDALDKRREGHDAAIRRQHYEQVGQFIAETAMLLIAVMGASEPADTTQANGGTARVVATRRAGRPDAIGAAVAARGRITRDEWSDLLAAPASYVWLIDPGDTVSRAAPPVTVLPPCPDRYDEDAFQLQPGRAMPTAQPPRARLLGLVLNGHDRLTKGGTRYVSGPAAKPPRPGARSCETACIWHDRSMTSNVYGARTQNRPR